VLSAGLSAVFGLSVIAVLLTAITRKPMARSRSVLDRARVLAPFRGYWSLSKNIVAPFGWPS